jgi:hypothetical protein
MAEEKKMTPEEFAKRHPPLDEEGIKKAEESAVKAKTEYAKNLESIEENLTAFFQRTEPIVIDGMTIAKMRIPPIKELRTYQKYFRDIIEGKSVEEAQNILNTDPECLKRQYEWIASLIVTPKHDAEWWEENASADFMVIFEKKLIEISNREAGNIHFF